MPLERMSKTKFGRMWKDAFQDSIDKSIRENDDIDAFNAPNLRNEISDMEVYELMVQKYPEYHDKYDFYDPAENEEMMTTPALVGLGLRDFGIQSVKGSLSLLEAASVYKPGSPFSTEGDIEQRHENARYFRNLRDQVDAWAENVAQTDPLVRAYTEWQGADELQMDDVFTKRSIPAIAQGFSSLGPVIVGGAIAGPVGAYGVAWLMSMGSSVERIADQLEEEGWEYDDALDMGILGGAMTATAVAYLEKIVPMAIMRGKTVKGLQTGLPSKIGKALKEFGTDKLGIKRSYEATLPTFFRGVGLAIGGATEEALTEGVQTIWEEAVARTFMGDRDIGVGKFGAALAETPWPEVAMSAYAGWWAGGTGSIVISGMNKAYKGFQEQKLPQPIALDKWVDKYINTEATEATQIMIGNLEALGQRPGQAGQSAHVIEQVKRGYLDVFNKAAPNPRIAKQAIRLAKEKLGWVDSTVESERVASGKVAYTKANPDGSLEGQAQQNIAASDIRKYSNPEFRATIAEMGSSPQADIINLIESNGAAVVQQLEQGEFQGQEITPQEMAQAINTVGTAIMSHNIVDSKGTPLSLLNEAGNFDVAKVIGATKFLVANEASIIRETQETGGETVIGLNIPVKPGMLSQLVNNPQNFENMPIDYGVQATDPRLQSAPVSEQDAQNLAGAQSIAPEQVRPSPQEMVAQQPLPSPEAMATDPNLAATSSAAIEQWLVQQDLQRQGQAESEARMAEAGQPKATTEPKPENPQELTNEQQDLFAPPRKQLKGLLNLPVEWTRSSQRYEADLAKIIKKYAPNVELQFEGTETYDGLKIPNYDITAGSYSESVIKLIRGIAGDDSAYHEVGHWWLSRVLSADEYAEVLGLVWNIRHEMKDGFDPKAIGELDRELLVQLEEHAADAAMSYLQGVNTFTGRLRELLRKFWFKIRQMLDMKFPLETSEDTLEQYFMRIGTEAETRTIDNISELLYMQGQGATIPLDVAVLLGDDKARTQYMGEMEDSFSRHITDGAPWVAAQIFNVPMSDYKPRRGSKAHEKLKASLEYIRKKNEAGKLPGISDKAPTILTKLGIEDALRKTNANVNVFKPIQISKKIRISPLESTVFESFMTEVKQLAKDRKIPAKMNPSDLADKYREFVETLYPLYEIASNTDANLRNRGGLGYGFKQAFNKEWFEKNRDNYDFKFTEVSITDDQWSSGHSYNVDEPTFMDGPLVVHPFGWYINGKMTNRKTGKSETVVYEHQRDVDPGGRRLNNAGLPSVPNTVDWRIGGRPIETKEDLAADMLVPRLFFPGYIPNAKAAHKIAHHVKLANQHDRGLMLGEGLYEFYQNEVVRPLRNTVLNAKRAVDVSSYKIGLYHILTESDSKAVKAIGDAFHHIDYVINPDSGENNILVPEGIQTAKREGEAIDIYVPWLRETLKTLTSVKLGNSSADITIDKIIDSLERRNAFYALTHTDWTGVNFGDATSSPKAKQVKVHIAGDYHTALQNMMLAFETPGGIRIEDFGTMMDPDPREVGADIKKLAKDKVVFSHMYKRALRDQGKAIKQGARFKNDKYASAFLEYAEGHYRRFLSYANNKLGDTAPKDRRVSDQTYVEGIADSWMAKSIRHSIYLNKAQGETVVWMPTLKSHVNIEGNYESGIEAALLYRVKEEAKATKGYFRELGRNDPTEDQLIGPFYISLVGIKGVRILGFEKPEWSKHKMLKVDISDVKVEPIERFQRRKLFAGRDVKKEIEVLKAAYSNSVIRNKARNIDHIIIERPDGEAARSMLFDSLSEMVGSKKKAYNIWIESKTERFTDWFGKSPVVDRNGEPIPMWETNVEGDRYTFSSQNTQGKQMPVFVRANNYVSARNQMDLFDKGQAHIDENGNVTVNSVTQFVNVNDTKFLSPKDNIKASEPGLRGDDDERDTPGIVDAGLLNFNFREIGEAHSKRNFIRDMGIYMTDEQYAQTATYAVTANTFEEFKTSIEKYATELKYKNRDGAKVFVYKYGGRSQEQLQQVYTELEDLFGKGFIYNRDLERVGETREQTIEKVTKYIGSLPLSAEMVVDNRLGLGRLMKMEIELAKKRGLKVQYVSDLKYELSEDLGRSFWQKMKNRTHRRSEEHPEGRLTFEMVFLSKEQQALTGQEFVILPSGTMRQTDGLAPANIKTGRQLPSTFMQSFPEAQGIRYGIISAKEIAQQRSRISQKTNEGGVGSANVIENFYFDYQFKLDPVWVEMIDKKFLAMGMQYQGQSLNFFFAPRAGDASQLIIGEVQKDLEGLTQDEFVEILKDEIERKKTMTMKHAKNLLASANKRAEWTVAMRKQSGTTVVKNPHAYAQILSWHRMAQQIAGSHYLMEQTDGEPNVQNWFNRLRITFNDGIVPKGTGESSMWFTNTEKIHFQVNGRKIEHRRIVQDLSGNDHDEGYAYDGFLFTGSAKLASITEASGKVDYIVKSFIRDVKMNPDGSPSRDMIGLKMLEGTPHPQMSIHDNQSGRKLASVITDDKGDTLWQLYDIDGNPTETVESLGSLDERKQGYGDTYGALQTRIVVPEHARRIKFLGGSAKRTAAHPVKMNELILDDKFLSESFAGREYLAAQTDYAEELAQDYSEMLLGFRENPIELLNYVKRDLQEGELPTEIQMYVQLIDNAVKKAKEQGQPNAENIAGAMFHGNIASQLMPMLNNSFFTEGLYQMRQIKRGYGSKLFLKPSIDLQLNDDEFAVGVQNSTTVNLVEQAYLDQGHKKIWAPNDFTGKVNLLNDWLAKNPLEFIIHRQPIQQPSSVRVYRLKKIVWGKHGQSAFFNMHNIFHVHEADHDGDTVFIERPSTANGMVMMSKLKNLMNDQAYLKRIRTLEFKIFDFQREATDLSSEADRMWATAANAVAIGAQGMIVNAKTALAIMGYKNIQIQTLADEGKRSAIYARKPSDTVYPTYLRVDPKMDKYIYDRLVSEGDAIVYFENGVEQVAEHATLEATAQELEARNQRLFYKTTAENEFSILLQMAVDNPKYGYLGLIGFGSNGDPVSFLIERMFYRLNEQGQLQTLTQQEIKMLKNVYAEFRYSAMAHGRDEFGNRQSVSDTYDKSKELSDSYLNEDGSPLGASEVSYLLAARVQAKAVKGVESILAISMNNKITPTEKLLTSIHQNWKKHFSSPQRQGRFNDIIDPVRYRLGSYQYAHIYAMNDIKGRYIKEMTSLLHKGSPSVVADMEAGRAMSQEAGTEFYALLDDRNKTAPPGARSDVVQAVRFEFNKEFAEFTDKWYNKIDTELGRAGHMAFSLWFLNGVEMLNLKQEQTKIDRITKVLPFPLFDEMVLSHYLQAYSRHILSPVKNMNDLGEIANFGLPFRQINEFVRDNLCG